ncbi:hypothetical protein N9299_04350 [Amylibacter sp.]|nr:hypothetical protein [Amylibacter sp.]
MNKNEIEQCVIESIAHINLQLPAEQKIELNFETTIVGPDSILDSLSLINLIVEIEERIELISGSRVSILDKGLMSEEFGSFQTIAELICWIKEQS